MTSTLIDIPLKGISFGACSINAHILLVRIEKCTDSVDGAGAAKRHR